MIKSGCQSGIKVVTHDSKNDLPLALCEKVDNILAVVAETFPDKAFVVFVLANPRTAAAGLLS